MTEGRCILVPRGEHHGHYRDHGTGLSGILRMTWMQDGLAHVLEHCEADEPSGTWTGLAGPDHGLALGSDVDNATLSHMCAHGEIADLIWEAPDDLTAEHRQVFEAAMDAHLAGNSKVAELLWQELQAIWSRAWSANYAALDLLQNAGLARFSPVKPQRWVIASFERHCGPHGLPHPHVHNIVDGGPSHLRWNCPSAARGGTGRQQSQPGRYCEERGSPAFSPRHQLRTLAVPTRLHIHV